MPPSTDASIDDDDDSSTEREMQKLWDKLDRMQEETRKKVEQHKPTTTFECPSSDESSCGLEEESLSSPVSNTASRRQKSIPVSDIKQQASAASPTGSFQPSPLAHAKHPPRSNGTETHRSFKATISGNCQEERSARIMENQVASVRSRSTPQPTDLRQEDEPCDESFSSSLSDRSVGTLQTPLQPVDVTRTPSNGSEQAVTRRPTSVDTGITAAAENDSDSGSKITLSLGHPSSSKSSSPSSKTSTDTTTGNPRSKSTDKEGVYQNYAVLAPDRRRRQESSSTGGMRNPFSNSKRHISDEYNQATKTGSPTDASSPSSPGENPTKTDGMGLPRAPRTRMNPYAKSQSQKHSSHQDGFNQQTPTTASATDASLESSQGEYLRAADEMVSQGKPLARTSSRSSNESLSASSTDPTPSRDPGDSRQSKKVYTYQRAQDASVLASQPYGSQRKDFESPLVLEIPRPLEEDSGGVSIFDPCEDGIDEGGGENSDSDSTTSASASSSSSCSSSSSATSTDTTDSHTSKKSSLKKAENHNHAILSTETAAQTQEIRYREGCSSSPNAITSPYSSSNNLKMSDYHRQQATKSPTDDLTTSKIGQHKVAHSSLGVTESSRPVLEQGYMESRKEANRKIYASPYFKKAREFDDNAQPDSLIRRTRNEYAMPTDVACEDGTSKKFPGAHHISNTLPRLEEASNSLDTRSSQSVRWEGHADHESSAMSTLPRPQSQYAEGDSRYSQTMPGLSTIAGVVAAEDSSNQKSQTMPIIEYHAPTQDQPEIDFSLYTPHAARAQTPPVLHRFNKDNCPPNARRSILVRDLFQSPISNLWNTKIDRFNAIQSTVANGVCHSDDHILVSAPTGAGKTAIFEMAMARFFSVDLSCQSRLPSGTKQVSKRRKIVYIAPSKALCEERFEDWCRRIAFMNSGIQVVMITGDAEPGRCYQDFADAHVILSTPEKWDSISRRWSEKFFLMATVKLFMIDEVHLLGDDSRGACLESIVCRMKSIQRAAKSIRVSQNEIQSSSYADTDPESIGSCMRMVAVSATLPNITEVAEFIGASEAFAFDESFRPIPLARHIVGLGYVGKNEFRFWSTLERHVPELVQKFSRGKPTLVFCHTKKETETLVGVLLKAGIGANPSNRGNGSVPGTVQYCLDNGVAYHHAGMEVSDRKRIEQAFLNRQLKCLCATSTLAVGVNLPAHLVIVKGTRTWRGGGSGYQDIDRSSLLQMIGRAGRPGLDTSGTAVIMTDQKSKQSIEKLMQGLGPAESYLRPKLLDIMNVEVSQRVVSDLESAINWLKTTFLYVRLQQDPEKYGCPPSEALDSHLLSLIGDTLGQLRDTGLIQWAEDGVVKPLEACHIMSQNMVSFGAMKRIADLTSETTQATLLKVLSEMDELHFPVRRLEKKVLNECHKTELIRYKLGALSKVRIQNPSQKAFVLLQAYIGHFEFQNFTLRQEMTSLADTAQRLLQAAQEYSVKGSKNGHVALLCLKLRRSLHFCLWGETSGVLNQISDPKVGQQSTKMLAFSGITSFEHVMASSEDAIERAAGRSKPFGRTLKTSVSLVLKERMRICAEIEYTRSNIAAGVACKLEPQELAVAALTGAEKAEVTFSMLAFTDRPGTSVFLEEGIRGAGSYSFDCPPKFGKMHIHLVGSLIGIDETLELEGNDTCTDSRQAKQSTRKSTIRNLTGSTRLTAGSVDEHGSRRIEDTDATRMQRKGHNGRGSQSTHKRKDPSQFFDGAGPQATITPKKSPATIPGGEVDCNAHEQSRRLGLQIRRAETNQGDARFDPAPPIDFLEDTESRLGRGLSPNPRLERFAPTESASTMAPGDVVRNAPDPSMRLGMKNTWAQSRYSHPLTTESDQRISPNQRFERTRPVPSVTPTYPGGAALAQHQQEAYRRTAATSSNQQDSRTSPRSLANNGAWKQAKRKQERSQKRAFPSKKDNPFAFFKHDPNDAESFLECLSSQGPSNSIIPEKELEKMTRNTASRVPRFNRSVTSRSRKTMPHPKRRRHISPVQRMSNTELLRMKAAEQDAYSTSSFGHNPGIADNAGSPFSRQTFSSPNMSTFQTRRIGSTTSTWSPQPQATTETYQESWPSEQNFQEVPGFEPATAFLSHSHGCFAPEDYSGDNESPNAWGPQGMGTPCSGAFPMSQTQYGPPEAHGQVPPVPQMTLSPRGSRDDDWGMGYNQAYEEPNYSNVGQSRNAGDPDFEQAFFHQIEAKSTLSLNGFQKLRTVPEP